MSALGTAVAWAERAACVGRDVEEFFTESRHRVQEIKNLCAVCTVREQCLTEAMRAEDTSRYGIYGGLTPAERNDLARGTR
jgi:WhiB family redox-sensing transcriptional regulator